MSRRRTNKARNQTGKVKGLTVDRKRRSGHYQGTLYSEVYRNGKVYVYTAWDDNSEEVGKAMPFESWVRSFG